MKLPLYPELVPAHIDGFVMQGDLRASRASARAGNGDLSTATPQHDRDELELNLAVRGHAHYLIGQNRVELTAQHMLWILPGQPRLVIDVSPDSKVWVLVFRPRALHAALTTDASAPLRQPISDEVLLRRLTRTQVRELSALYAGIPVGHGRDVFNTGLAYALTRSWQAYREAELAEPLSEVHVAVRKAAWLLREERDALSNSDLSAACGLSAQRLSRLFKQQMGTSLSEFRNRQRLERVLRRLALHDHTALLQAAYDAGFGSYAQFHRVFLRYIGCNPSTYLARANGGAQGATGTSRGGSGRGRLG